jgi:desulfoferrodoxin (superoxide reductase-like protein)
VWTGKENSHEPKPVLVDEGGKPRVEVKVEHVMGQNKLDAGAPVDAGSIVDAATKPDASMVDAGADSGIKADAAPPMEHYITTIYLRGVVDGVDRVVGLWEFSSSDAAPPTARFTLPAGVKSVVAYEWCTLHGLWRAPALAVG